jgi:hypothetical protein
VPNINAESETSPFPGKKRNRNLIWFAFLCSLAAPIFLNERLDFLFLLILGIFLYTHLQPLFNPIRGQENMNFRFLQMWIIELY